MKAPLHLFNGLVTIYRRTRAADLGGGSVLTGAPLATATDVPCRVVGRTGNESVRSGAERAQYPWLIYVEPISGLLENDYAVTGGRTFEVRSILDFDQLGVLMRLDCEELKGATV